MEQNYPRLSIPSKEEIKKVMENPGKIKGASLKGEIEYVLEKKGEEGLKLVERETERLGFPIEYRKIKEINWYPIGLKIVSLAAVLNTFNWGRKELAKIAESAPKVSYIIKLFLRFFISPAQVVEIGAPRMWRRYFTLGKCKSIAFKDSEKGGYNILRIENFKLHPLYCFFLGYWFIGVARLIKPTAGGITVKETKCMFKGDDYHEYLIKWTYK